MVGAELDLIAFLGLARWGGHDASIVEEAVESALFR